jgi:hypothetical protein
MKALFDLRRQQELERAAQICRRLAVEKHVGIRSEFVLLSDLLEKPDDREIVRQDADTPW